MRSTLRPSPWLMALVTLGAIMAVAPAAASPQPGAPQEEGRTVRANVQPRPGAPAELMEMRVREVPVDPASIAADEADLADDELVLGVMIDGQPMAYPIRYLAAVEVVNDVVGDTSLAPTW